MLVALVLLVESAIGIVGGFMLWGEKRQEEEAKKEARRGKNG